VGVPDLGPPPQKGLALVDEEDHIESLSFTEQALDDPLHLADVPVEDGCEVDPVGPSLQR